MKHTQLAKWSFLLWLFLATPAWAGVGYIQILNGVSGDFQLIRNSQQEKVEANKLLEVGDQILVRKNKASLWLWLGQGKLVELTYPKTHPNPYVVSEGPAAPNELKGFLATVGTWFTRLYEHHNDLVSSYTKGTSTPLFSIPLLDDKQILSAGRTTLSLGWQGGQPPYQVQVTLQGTPQNWKQPVPTETWVTLTDFQATPGHYLVTVSDAKQNMVRGVFEVVTDSILLQHAQAQAIQHLPGSFENRQTLLASWLATQPGKRLEAYQQIIGITQFEPALWVKQGLEGKVSWDVGNRK